MKLAITLRHVASGDCYKSFMYGFRVPDNIISVFVPELCEAIKAEFAEEVIVCPTRPEEWCLIARQFGARWNFHNALGALESTHLSIRCPDGARSLYYNYCTRGSIPLSCWWVDVGFHSIILLAGLMWGSMVQHLIAKSSIRVN